MARLSGGGEGSGPGQQMLREGARASQCGIVCVVTDVSVQEDLTRAALQ